MKYWRRDRRMTKPRRHFFGLVWFDWTGLDSLGKARYMYQGASALLRRMLVFGIYPELLLPSYFPLSIVRHALIE